MMECLNLENVCTEGPTTELFLNLVTTLMTAQCALNTKNLYPENYQGDDEFDYIVVGAGSAGSTIASRLSEDPNLHVLLIEAGGYPPPSTEVPRLVFNFEGTDLAWNHPVESPDACRGYTKGNCRWATGKMLGGSSSINHLLFLKGNQNDYDTWEEAGNEGWGWKNIENIFAKILVNITNYSSNRKIREVIFQAAKELDIIVSEQPQAIGYFDSPISTTFGRRNSAAKSYLSSAKDRSNLKIMLNSKVEKVNIKDGSAIGVFVNNKIIVAKREVILSAGVINTPEVLLKSGIGPAEQINSLGLELVMDLPVGKNLQDHLTLNALFIAINEELEDPQENAAEEIFKYYIKGEGIYSNLDISNIVGFINTKHDSPFPNVLIFHIFYPKGSGEDLSKFLKSMGLDENIIERMMVINNEHTLLYLMPTLIKPKSRGEVILDSLNLPPRVKANYLTHPDDMAVMLEALDYIKRYVQTPIMKKYNASILDHYPPCSSVDGIDLKCFVRTFGGTTYDTAGSCKMGPKENEGVVDNFLKVYGVKGLRVADCSIMPIIVSGNTNAPAIMIGERAAEIILKDGFK